MTDEFNVREVVREVLRSSTMADPGDVAAEVFRRIAGDDYAEALRQLLRLFVRQVISEERVSHAPAPAPVASHSPTPQGESRPARGHSPKVRAIRDGWQRRLADRVHVGSSTWKFLRDCTYDDLLSAASERRQLSERNAAWARTYGHWARLLTEHDVETFGQLPANVLQDTLGAAA